mmetsp:Transcript_15776/g.43641  ORF Transcript_15776/g.43641 Transcript_15776/m.43641 type:complete len:255 (-) Transcript_15776:31-795(-)
MNETLITTAEESPLLDFFPRRTVRVEACFWTIGLVLVFHWNTETLRSHLQATHDFRFRRFILRLCLNHIFARRISTEGNQDHLAGVQKRTEILPLSGRSNACVSLGQSLGKELIVDVVQGLLNILDHLRIFSKAFGSLGVGMVSLCNHKGLLFNVFGSDLNSDRNTFHFPMIELPARGVVSLIKLDTNPSGDEFLAILLAFLFYLLSKLVWAACFQSHRHDNNLESSNSRRQYQTSIVTVDHNWGSHGSGGESP